MTDVVLADSLVTLHYRIALPDGTELISTFDASPATLKLGCGELAPTLERCLLGLAVGRREVFDLEPEHGFGLRHPQLVERMKRADLPADAELEAMAVIEFAAPDGSKYTGLVRELTPDTVLIDFNHPLAGKSIRFEVQVVGIL
jgi:FKBP-type peptidyl-prolyl cis-trans isomerase SlpA